MQQKITNDVQPYTWPLPPPLPLPWLREPGYGEQDPLGGLDGTQHGAP